MNVYMTAPCGVNIAIMPDSYSPTCPIIIMSNSFSSERMKAVRRYCNGEGWIEMAEERWVADPVDAAFLETIYD